MSVDVDNSETLVLSVPSQASGWVALILGALVSLGAISWLLFSLWLGGLAALVIPGLIQLGIGVFLLASRWIIPNSKHAIIAAVVLLLINGSLGLWFGIGALPTSRTSSAQRKVLMVHDSDSPIAVSIEDSRGSWQNHPVWSGTIYADGKRPTQYTGWPVHLIGKNANPTELIWHNDDPDWVEIRFDTGKKLKLTWDPIAVFDARLIRDLHYFLNPEFELIR